MGNKLVRVTDEAHEHALALGELTGKSIVTAVSAAIEQAYQEAFWASAARQVQDMKESDPAAWEAYRAEAREWEQADADLGDQDVPA